jgi:hypothetical protein
MMSEAFQEPQFNQQQGWGLPNPNNFQNHFSNAGIGGNFGNNAIGYGLGNAAYGQAWNQQGAQPFWQPNNGAQGGFGAPWGHQQRQLSQQDVGDVVRQILPLLPQIIAQAQPQAAYGNNAGAQFNPWNQQGNFQQSGNNWGQQGRVLSQQDVNEVVRQILPVLPQIAHALQGHQHHQHLGFANQSGQNPFNQGGFNQNPYTQAGFNQGGFGQAFAGQQNPLQNLFGQQQGFGQQSPFLAAFGGQQQRQLSQQDVNEVTRQLIAVIPQVVSLLQQQNQQRNAQ